MKVAKINQIAGKANQRVLIVSYDQNYCVTLHDVLAHNESKYLHQAPKSLKITTTRILHGHGHSFCFVCQFHKAISPIPSK